MKQLRTIAIDDREDDLNQICEYINNHSDLIFQGGYTDPLLALTKLSNVDLVFLDVEMGNISGLNIIQYFPEDTNVVLITAQKDYAVNGFNLSVTDFLLKPYNEERFLKSVEKVKKNSLKSQDSNELVTIKTRDKGKEIIVPLQKSKIVYVESDGSYVKIFTTVRPQFYHLRSTLEGCNELLGYESFFQIHRQLIINKSYILQIHTSKKKIEMTNGTLLSFGDAYINNLWDRLS